MMLKQRLALTLGLAVTTTTASAFWGWMPWGGNGYNNPYNRGYGSSMGYMGGEQFRGGEGDGAADFSMSLSARVDTDMRGRGTGYGAGDGWGRGYNYSAPYYGGYGMPPYGRGMMPMQSLPKAR